MPQRALFGRGIDRWALFQHGRVVSPVTGGRRDEFQGAVPVLLVVPRHELPHPGPRRLQALKGLAGVGRAVLQGAEQGFRVGVCSPTAG